MIDFSLLPPYTRIVLTLSCGDTLSVLACYAQAAIDAQVDAVMSVVVDLEGGAL